MARFHFHADRFDAAFEHLLAEGYAVIENAIPSLALVPLVERFDALSRAQAAAPFDPGDGPAHASDASIEAFYRRSYDVTAAELVRLMRRVRHTRAQNLDTPWPVPIEKVNKNFLHIPLLYDQDRSQRIFYLIAKAPGFGALAEHPGVLAMARQILGEDCLLADFAGNTIGPQTGGGAWHVDAPLGQLPEPLPEFPITLQNVWLLDDFTPENGATRVVPRSHLTRRRPDWKGGDRDDEVALVGPAGSVAIWLSATWHRSGANRTNRPRRAVISYYARSWVRPMVDLTDAIDPATARGLSPQLRYLMGLGAKCPVRDD